MEKQSKGFKEYAFRWFFYIGSLLVLAFGIILNTKAGLGVSPIISVAYASSVITDTNFGNDTFILYSLLVIAEMILHAIHSKTKKEEWKKQGKKLPMVWLFDILQMVLSLVFTRFMNLFSFWVPNFATDFEGTVFSTLWFRLIVLAFAIIFTGIGAAASLNMRIIPNPGDGIVQAISDTIGTSVGTTKNGVDITCVITTILVSLIATGHLVGVGIGTICAMIGVGRVVAVFNHFCKEKMGKLSGITY